MDKINNTSHKLSWTQKLNRDKLSFQCRCNNINIISKERVLTTVKHIVGLQKRVVIFFSFEFD